MADLSHREGPGYLELPQASDRLLKSLTFSVAAFLAHLAECKLEAEWGLFADGFYMMKGIVVGLFMGALYFLAFSRVVRFENRVARITVRRGVRLFHLIPVWWTYDCDELTVQYVEGRTNNGRPVRVMDFWKIRGTRRRGSLWGSLFGDLAVFSKKQHAMEFMRLVLRFVSNVRTDLPVSNETVIQLTPRNA